MLPDEQCTSARIAALTGTLITKMTKAIEEISEINDYTHILSLNARIEAARAGGESGAAFGVVAQARSSDLRECIPARLSPGNAS